MAFGVHQKVSHDISLAFGKGLQGLKVEAMANQGKPRKGLSGRTLVESVMLGVLTITVAAIPVVVTRVPAPESLVIVKEILQEWCTPSVCFGVLIIGVLIVTFGGGAAEPPSTPEQNHKKFADSYLTQGPVSATQIDPLRMPDIFFSADATRTHALNHSASFPARVAQPSSVMVPVYYPAFVSPPQRSPFSSHSEKDAEFMLGRFESDAGERFVPRMDERFASRVDDRFSPRVVDARFSPRVDERFAPRGDEWFSPKLEPRFGPRADERFSPRVEERFSPKVDERFVPRGDERYMPQAEERYVPRVEERYVPQVEKRYVPQVEERYVPQVEERYEPQVEERYEPQVEERYEPQVEERYEPQEQDRFDAEEEDAYEPAEEVQYGAHIESRAESDFQDERRYVPESDREDEAESEREAQYIESEADDEGEAEPEPEMQSDSGDEVENHSHEAHTPPPQQQQQEQQKQEQEQEQSPGVGARKAMSPPHSPIAEVAAVPPAQRQSHNVVEAPSSLLSRRRPPTVPAPVIVDKASPPPPPPPPASEPAATSSPEPRVSPETPKMSVRVERKEAPEISPRTPPKHATERRTSASSRSYGEFVRRTIDCPLPTPKTPSPSTRPKPAAPLPSLDEKLARLKARRHSTGGMSLMAQTPVPNKRPREVRVVDDDKLDDKEELTQDDDVDQRVEAFLKNFREQMRLQRQESLQRHRRGELDA